MEELKSILLAEGNQNDAELTLNALVKSADFKDFLDAVKHLGVFCTIINELPKKTKL